MSKIANKSAARSKEQLDSYMAKTQVSFEEYHEWFDDDMSKTLNDDWIKMMYQEYFSKDALGDKNYMEIGIGRGYVLSHFHAYFKQLCLIEPNDCFIKSATSRILNKEPNKFIQVIPKFVDDFDPAKDLNNVFIRNKFDFINIQNIFWHINLSKWESVLNNLFSSLKTENVEDGKLSLLNITFTDSRSAFMNIHRHFVPEFRSTQYIVDHFKKVCINNKNIKMKVIKDPLSFDLPESGALQLMMDWLKLDFAIYNVSFDDLDINEVKSVIKRYWKLDGAYTNEIDPESGECIIKCSPGQVHFMLTVSS